MHSTYAGRAWELSHFTTVWATQQKVRARLVVNKLHNLTEALALDSSHWDRAFNVRRVKVNCSFAFAFAFTFSFHLISFHLRFGCPRVSKTEFNFNWVEKRFCYFSSSLEFSCYSSAAAATAAADSAAGVAVASFALRMLTNCGCSDKRYTHAYLHILCILSWYSLSSVQVNMQTHSRVEIRSLARYHGAHNCPQSG